MIRDMLMGGVGCHAAQCCQICKKVGHKSGMLQESWPQCLRDLFFFKKNSFLVEIAGQLIKHSPPQFNVSRHITVHDDVGNDNTGGAIEENGGIGDNDNGVNCVDNIMIIIAFVNSIKILLMN